MEKTAREANLILCLDCDKLNPAMRHQPQTCTRCGATIDFRFTRSVQKTWALLIASMVAFIPANIYPIMTVSTFGNGKADTILSGIVSLAKAGMLPIAIVVFIASFIVPLGKIVGLIILLLSIRQPSQLSKNYRTFLYRIIQVLGKWSMLDVFVVTIMVAVVHLGFISEITPGAGATAFTLVVILTMLAAHTFDPRLIWDESKKGNPSNDR